jgi:formylglycine-generating enzyme
MQRPLCAAIPAGSFMMGCEQGRDEEKPVHRVWVDAFEMAVHQVRNRDYACFLESSGRAAPPQWTDPNLNHPDQPVVSVSWFDAVAYCDWLSGVCGHSYRLPTEAEWELGAHGGREGSLWVWGDLLGDATPQSRPEYLRRWGGVVSGPKPVGEEAPNPFGIFDLGENVHEWCADWYGKDYYAISPERNPGGPTAGDRRASRGGSWRHHIKVSRCAARSSIPPAFQYADYGFRVVCGARLVEL